ncbi:MAG: type III-A CRISPR-associated RAMP protein Csm5 [Endomicrobiia bacterium]
MKTYKLECKILSPVHIGDGTEIYPYEYIIKQGKFYKIELENFLQQLSQNEQNKFPSLVENNIIQLREFLVESFNPDKHSFDYCVDVSNNVASLYTTKINDELNQLIVKPFIKTKNTPYIPGSSIKGAIRTAIAYYLLKHNQNLMNTLKKELWSKARTIIDKLIFQNNDFGTNNDKLRVLLVSDSSLLSTNSLKIEVIQRLASKPQKQSRSALLGFKIYCETLKKDTTITSEILINDKLSDKLLDSSWKQLLSKEGVIKCCLEFSKDLIDLELEYFNNHPEKDKLKGIIEFYEHLKNKKLDDSCFFLSLGQGGGFYQKTIAMLLEKDKDFRYKEFIKKFGRKNQGKKLTATSRSIVVDNQNYYVLGWLECRLKDLNN